MDPDKLPAGTEYSYAHLFTPHPQLLGVWIPPINPNTNMNTPQTLPELQIRNDVMKPPRSRGSRRPENASARRPIVRPSLPLQPAAPIRS